MNKTAVTNQNFNKINACILYFNMLSNNPIIKLSY